VLVLFAVTMFSIAAAYGFVNQPSSDEAKELDSIIKQRTQLI